MTAQACAQDCLIAQRPHKTPSTWNAPTQSILPRSSSFLQQYLKSQILSRRFARITNTAGGANPWVPPHCWDRHAAAPIAAGGGQSTQFQTIKTGFILHVLRIPFCKCVLKLLAFPDWTVSSYSLGAPKGRDCLVHWTGNPLR